MSSQYPRSNARLHWKLDVRIIRIYALREPTGYGEAMPMDSESKTAASATGESSSQGRGRSTIEFPYGDLDDAIEVAKSVHTVGGTSCAWDQLAGAMNQAPKGGGFRSRVMFAKLYGLLTYSRGTVELSDLGIRIIDPKFARAARVESFLAVPLFRAGFDKFKGSPLPPMAAIERQFEQLGVAPKQKDKARQVFMRAAKQAGFFEIAADRLISPNVNASGSNPVVDQIGDDQSGQSGGSGGGSGGNGGGDGCSGIPSALLGLLEKLPPPGSTIPPKRRKALIDAFASAINFLYPEDEEGAAG